MAGYIEHVDVSEQPELRKLAEEVQRSQQPRILERDQVELAIILPLTSRTAAGREQAFEAQVWADVGGSGPASLWSHYDAAAVSAALREAEGMFSGIDRAGLLRDLREERD
jgi:hypothetical protein